MPSPRVGQTASAANSSRRYFPLKTRSLPLGYHRTTYSSSGSPQTSPTKTACPLSMSSAGRANSWEQLSSRKCQFLFPRERCILLGPMKAGMFSWCGQNIRCSSNRYNYLFYPSPCRSVSGFPLPCLNNCIPYHDSSN